MTRILVVDDDPDQAALVRCIVRRRGIAHGQVAHAPCVDDAVARIGRERFENVLLDHHVPPHDTASIAVPRLRRAGHAGPITVMSGVLPSARTMAALATSGVTYVSKFDLIAHLAAMLDEDAAA